MTIRKKIYLVILTFIGFGFLSACGIWDPADARKVPPSDDERVRKNLEEGRGIT